MTNTVAGFAARLREAARPYHRDAESAGYIETLVAGGLTRPGYAAMVAQHWFIYQALEAAADTMRGDPVASGFLAEPLRRLPALRADLAFLMGPDWAGRIAPSPATRAYCDRLHEVGFTWPAGFIAHHYTRYLGDLSGGQAIRQALVRRYRLDDGRGVSFYGFGGLGSLPEFKRQYRERLDTLPYPEAELYRMIEEVGRAYRLNTAVFADLERDTEQFRDPFPPEVVAQIARHMNDDHPADSLLIARAFGGHPTATAARMTGLDAAGLDFTVTVDGGPLPARVPFARRLTARAEVRHEVVRLFNEARARLRA